ncbi:DNA polymerase III subunit delta [Paenibacillus crassostreae]|uniref:DNA polymerase III subunit delta n=1 Tax=Paenibacillus crassostreae TaxID=1763538 RepID=A0A167C1L7_9BACL|nr:DNA polymerase III subunit delta [Paenibacillus crassostreae]AOZ91756.1 DNA polymerase III subunit delta [Paenibacillus crassostreae]OAB72671.1 DNA polymerase III subunit delta [Paenibacillus crassostreae]
MDIKAATKAIKHGDVSPVYLLYGLEKYQIKEFTTLLVDELIQKEDRDFALVNYDLSESSIQDVIEEAETLPFMVPRKLIFVRDASVFTAGKEGGKIEHRIEALLEYLKNPAEYSILIFLVHHEKLDERKKVVKALNSAGIVLSFSPLGGHELIGWIERESKQRGCILATGAADILIRNAGAQLQNLSAELDKLCLYVGAGGTIDSNTVEQLVSRSTEQNVFALVENMANLRLEEALSIYYELLKQREEPIKIAALITRQFRIILQVKELMGQSYSQAQIASQLGLHPYAVKIAGEQARKYKPDVLKSILSRLTDLDYQMKTGRIDKVLGLELFLLRLAV